MYALLARHWFALVCYALALTQGVLGAVAFGMHDYSGAFDNGALAALWCFWPFLNNLTARSGWRRGYEACRANVHESQRRGLTVGQWDFAELERALGRDLIRVDQGYELGEAGD
jgi:hypothetical protein